MTTQIIHKVCLGRCTYAPCAFPTRYVYYRCEKCCALVREDEVERKEVPKEKPKMY